MGYWQGLARRLSNHNEAWTKWPTYFRRRLQIHFLERKLCFAVLISQTYRDSCGWCSHILQGCFTGTGAVSRLPQCQTEAKGESVHNSWGVLVDWTSSSSQFLAMYRYVFTTCKNLEKLQKVQNYAARITSGNFDYINVRSISLIRSLKWMTISEICEYFTAMLMFKAINGLVPNYSSDSIVMAGEAHDRDTRLSESLDVHIPSHNSSTLKLSFIYNGSVLWNAAPEKIKASESMFTFKKRYKEQIIDPLLDQ